MCAPSSPQRKTVGKVAMKMRKVFKYQSFKYCYIGGGKEVTTTASGRTSSGTACLVLDNCSAHHIENLELTNVELKFLPRNCTSLIQSLDQGIINSAECSYRRRLVDKRLLDLRLKRQTKVDTFQDLEILSASWKVTAKEVIKNCFRKAGFETVPPRKWTAKNQTEGLRPSLPFPEEVSTMKAKKLSWKKTSKTKRLFREHGSPNSQRRSRSVWCRCGGLSLWGLVCSRNGRSYR
ncbi:hypothetical protein HPB47_015223 [Ixodes persulcatus]|uniref:Uncharacterized protein n=1 Tax=Ixodes persulcatus TaxID=34615 RepID=A0AC60QU36_IXOPE|nr:hypothetical protein HPB47_015223 [Ixodes persulcatus]